MNTPLHSGLSSSLQGNLHSEPVFGFLPSDLTGLKLWTRFNSGITVTGAGVSQWDDVSGNGNHLLQAVDANRMTKEADGSILGNGVDQFLKAAAFTWSQPETIYILGKQVTWTSNDRWFDGNTLNSGTISQSPTTPDINLYAGSFMTNPISPPLDIYVVISAVINGASSVLQLNNEPPSTAGTTGANNMGGFTLGATGAAGLFANIQIKEVIGYSTAHDAAQRLQIINYLNGVGGLSI